MKLAAPKKESALRRFLSLASRIVLVTFAASATAQSASPAPSNPPTPQTAARPAHPTPPIRDPHSPGFVAATELPDGAVPPANVDGNFILGPAHPPAPQLTVHAGVPQGTVWWETFSLWGRRFGVAHPFGRGMTSVVHPTRDAATCAAGGRLETYAEKGHPTGQSTGRIIGMSGEKS